jgi:hypothetical protein
VRKLGSGNGPGEAADVSATACKSIGNDIYLIFCFSGTTRVELLVAEREANGTVDAGLEAQEKPIPLGDQPLLGMLVWRREHKMGWHWDVGCGRPQISELRNSPGKPGDWSDGPFLISKEPNSQGAVMFSMESRMRRLDGIFVWDWHWHLCI